MSAVEASKWWLVVAVGLPSFIAAGWATRDEGLVARLAIVGALIWWQVWIPVPAFFGVLRAHRSSADATAERLMASAPSPGGCHPPTPS